MDLEVLRKKISSPPTCGLLTARFSPWPIALFFALANSANGDEPLREVVTKAVACVQQEQSQTDGAVYAKGEWPAQMHTSSLAHLVGVGRNGEIYEDPSVYVTASVTNLLAEIYIADQNFSEIPTMLRAARPNFEKYKNGNVFNFWQMKEVRPGLYRRGPKTLHIKNYLSGITNIPDDSDDTSVVYIAQLLNQVVDSLSMNQECTLATPDLTSIFSAYRDVNRSPNPFNWFYGYRNTGAFLTWMTKESNDPFRFLMHPDEPNVVLGKNDVDCIVNTHVLRALGMYEQIHATGVKEACKYVNDTIARKEFLSCNIFYPNRYFVHYNTAKALSAKVQCLERSRKNILGDLLHTQLKDGSWVNRGAKFKENIQSTLFALNSLLLLGDRQNKKHRQAVEKAVAYLLQAAQIGPKSICWEPGIFFTAGTLMKQQILWKSKAFTTALAARALQLSESWLQEQ